LIGCIQTHRPELDPTGCYRTDDPAKQQEWNHLFIKQWEEVLTLCGPDLVNEIWLDGGCVIDINQVATSPDLRFSL
jgi:hypothetical protein